MQLSIENNELRIALSFGETLLAFKHRFIIPLAQIQSISHALPKPSWNEWRVPGAFVPGLIKSGTYFVREDKRWKKNFWYVTRGNTAYLVLHLQGSSYDTIVLGLRDVQSIPKILREKW